MRLSFVLFFFAYYLKAQASSHPLIPRTASNIYIASGVFEGGGVDLVNLEKVRFWKNPETDQERWVLDFSSISDRKLHEKAPYFKLTILPADKIFLPHQREKEISPAKIEVQLAGVQNSFINKKTLKTFLNQSTLVKSFFVSSPSEGGQASIEIVLNHSVLVEPHQPISKEGRLVIDLKPQRMPHEKKR